MKSKVIITNTQWFAIMKFQSDNSMYCMIPDEFIPDPFPGTSFGKGSATPDYLATNLCYMITFGTGIYSCKLMVKVTD